MEFVDPGAVGESDEREMSTRTGKLTLGTTGEPAKPLAQTSLPSRWSLPKPEQPGVPPIASSAGDIHRPQPQSPPGLKLTWTPLTGRVDQEAALPPGESAFHSLANITWLAWIVPGTNRLRAVGVFFFRQGV